MAKNEKTDKGGKKITSAAAPPATALFSSSSSSFLENGWVELNYRNFWKQVNVFPLRYLFASASPFLSFFFGGILPEQFPDNSSKSDHSPGKKGVGQ